VGVFREGSCEGSTSGGKWECKRGRMGWVCFARGPERGRPVGEGVSVSEGSCEGSTSGGRGECKRGDLRGVDQWGKV
jgi:hypothetical protein